MVQVHVWLWVLHICQNDAFVFIIMEQSLPKKIKFQIQNPQNRRSGEMDSCLFETYKN